MPIWQSGAQRLGHAMSNDLFTSPRQSALEGELGAHYLSSIVALVIRVNWLLKTQKQDLRL